MIRNDFINITNMTQGFWNRTWAEFEPFEPKPIIFREKTGQSDKIFLNLVGEVSGKTVLDIGCGNGVLSVYLAKMGGRVTAIDNPALAIRNTRTLARTNKVDSSIEAHRLDVIEVNKLGRSFDVVVGKLILHHMDPLTNCLQMLQQNGRVGLSSLFLINGATFR